MMQQTAIILGSGSDIGQALISRLRDDGYFVQARRSVDPLPLGVAWDLVVCCYGLLDPIGPFWETDSAEWEYCFDVNLLHPLRTSAVCTPTAGRGPRSTSSRAPARPARPPPTRPTRRPRSRSSR